MQGNALSSRLAICLGAVLFALGLVGDGSIGIFLWTTGDLRLLLLHVPLVFIWVLGSAFINGRDRQGGRKGRPYQTWGTAFYARQGDRKGRSYDAWRTASIVSPLLLGLFTFPGFGPFTYSIALVLTHFLHYEVAEGTVDASEQSLGTMAQSLTKSRPLDLAIQPLVDVLHDVDMETRRTAITMLSRSATPGAIRLLRQML